MIRISKYRKKTDIIIFSSHDFYQLQELICLVRIKISLKLLSENKICFYIFEECVRDVLGVTVIFLTSGLGYRISYLQRSCITPCTEISGKDMNSTILPPAMYGRLCCLTLYCNRSRRKALNSTLIEKEIATTHFMTKLDQ